MTSGSLPARTLRARTDGAVIDTAIAGLLVVRRHMAAGGDGTVPSPRCSTPAARLLPSRAKPPLEAKPQAAARHARSSDPQGSEIVLRHCDSCGRDDEDVVRVR